MADKPILFSAPMVRALLAGQKTQTRRAINLPTKTFRGHPIYERKDMGGWAPTTTGGPGTFMIVDGQRVEAPELVAMWHQTTGDCFVIQHQPGDVLWVREAWRVEAQHDAIKPSLLTPCRVGYGADETPGSISRTGKLRPSMFMPRWASRLTLIVTETRVQRLQDISESDADSEGIDAIDGAFDEAEFTAFASKHNLMCEDGRTWFAWLWDNINAKRPGLSWADNPWIVAYSFDVQRDNVDAYLARAGRLLDGREHNDMPGGTG